MQNAELRIENLLDLQKASYDLLKDHPTNLERVKNGKRPANSIWLWGEGRKPHIENFFEKYGKKASVVSAVDLIKGIGICAGMNVREVPGATGYIDTNFEGKARAALSELRRGRDLVYLHVEAPDECSHRFEPQNKRLSIELIDKRVIKLVLEGLSGYDDYKILVMPDHATPLCKKTHTNDPVPFLIYQKSREIDSGVQVFDELSAKESGWFVEEGHTIMEIFLGDA